MADRKHPHGRGEDILPLNVSGLIWKHPHGRGEDMLVRLAGLTPMETPPRAWGRHLELGLEPARQGNTPTGVGKTGASWQGASRSRKHPHGRGEDASPAGTAKPTPETPPRAWGRLERDPVGHLGGGNTPTGVGKTSQRVPVVSAQRKHPHGRGEDRLSPSEFPSLAETPPRAWGRLKFLDRDESFMGNTPTGVGKTWRNCL